MPLQEILDADRQLPDARAGRVIDRIGDRRRGSDVRDLADPLHAGRIDVLVFLRTRMTSIWSMSAFTGIR